MLSAEGGRSGSNTRSQHILCNSLRPQAGPSPSNQSQECRRTTNRELRAERGYLADVAGGPSCCTTPCPALRCAVSRAPPPHTTPPRPSAAAWCSSTPCSVYIPQGLSRRLSESLRYNSASSAPLAQTQLSHTLFRARLPLRSSPFIRHSPRRGHRFLCTPRFSSAVSGARSTCLP